MEHFKKDVIGVEKLPQNGLEQTIPLQRKPITTETLQCEMEEGKGKHERGT